MSYETVRSLRLAIGALLVAVTILPAQASAQSIATYQFGTGAITFGMALPQGATSSGVQIGSLQTQTDVKTRWSDGSVRFAVVSANIGSGGSYAINAAAAAAGTFTPTWPTIAFELNIGGTTYTASPGAFNANDAWLSGPVVRESRVISRPASGGSQHPLLEVVFDIRSYASGAHRIDVTVQNVRDSADMDKVAISSAALKVNNSTIWSHDAVTSYSMTRWRVVRWSGGSEAGIVPDFEPAFLSRAIPRVLPNVTSRSYDVNGANYDLMGGRSGSGAFTFGEMNPDMSAAGGRQEIGPLHWWEAVYIVHRTANQRAAVLRNADLTGAWSNHLTKANGSIIKLGEPGYDPGSWFWDNRANPGSRPLVPVYAPTNWRGAREGLTSDTDTGAAGVPAKYDAEHVPAPMYFAYLISGDRYYVDQAKYWATRAILAAIPYWTEPDPVNFPGWRNGRNGATGNERILDVYGMTREFSWPVRLVAYATWMVPDADGDKGYFLQTVQNNLNHAGEYLDTWVRLGYGGAMGAIGGAERPTFSTIRGGQQTGRFTPLWRMNYTAYVVDWCTRQGLWDINGSVDAFVTRVVNMSVLMNLQNPAFLTGRSGLSAPYYPAFNTMSDGRFNRWFNTFAEVKEFNETYAYSDDRPQGNPNWDPNQPATGYYNADEHVALQIALRRGVAGAQLAVGRLAQIGGHEADLASRAGYAISFTGDALPPVNLNAPTPPAPPTNVRIVH